MSRPTKDEIAAMSEEQRKLAAETAMTTLLTSHLDETVERGAFHPGFRMESQEHRMLLAAQLAPLVLQLAQDIAQGLVTSTIDGFGRAMSAVMDEKTR